MIASTNRRRRAVPSGSSPPGPCRYWVPPASTTQANASAVALRQPSSAVRHVARSANRGTRRTGPGLPWARGLPVEVFPPRSRGAPGVSPSAGPTVPATPPQFRAVYQQDHLAWMHEGTLEAALLEGHEDLEVAVQEREGKPSHLPACPEADRANLQNRWPRTPRGTVRSGTRRARSRLRRPPA